MSDMFEIKETPEGIIIEKYIGNDTDVVVPESINGLPVIAIGDNAFKNNEKLEHVDLPETITTLGNSVFEGCTNLEFFVMPNSVEKMGCYCFTNCVSLKTATLSDKLTEIPYWTYNGCINLQGVSIPSSVQEFNYFVFSKCPSTLTFFCEPNSYALNCALPFRKECIAKSLENVLGDDCYVSTSGQAHSREHSVEELCM